MIATLPIEYDRTFSIHLYWVSHGLLLLRSGKTRSNPTRVDILFQDVRWMTLPVWLEGVRIEPGELSDIPLTLTAKIKGEAHFMSVYRLISQGITHCLLASKSVQLAEDQDEYAADSSLLPDIDFRALVAPVFKEKLPIGALTSTNLPDSRMPNEAQQRKLSDMLHHALVDIRMLAAGGHEEQASDLADAFHNLPHEIWCEYFSFTFFREAFLIPYYRKWPIRQPRDYIALLNEAEKLR